MDYKTCPYRTEEDIGPGMGPGAVCRLTTKFLLNHSQWYKEGHCVECSIGENPQTLNSPVLQDLIRRTCRAAFVNTTSAKEITSPKIRANFLKKLKALGESKEDLERHILKGATVGIIDASEAAILYDEVHSGEVEIPETG